MPKPNLIPSAVFGKQIVTTSNPLAVNAGMEIISAGGNAVDGALAAAACLTVVEPTMNGLGGDLMALVWDKDKVHALEGVGWSPAYWEGLEAPKRLRGWSTVTVPGQVRAWASLHQKFGSLEWQSLFSRALTYAKEGFIVSQKTAALWRNLPADLTNQPGFKEEFLKSGAPSEGDYFRPQSIARALERIASSYGEDFYTGEIARAIIQQANVDGARWTDKDLSEWSPTWIDTVSTPLDTATLHEMPPPSQGFACSLANAIYECWDQRSDFSELSRTHVEIECMKLAIHFSQPICADFPGSESRVKGLMTEENLKALASKIRLDRTLNLDEIRHQSGGTVLVVTVDPRGQVCVLIQSNFYGFGSGVVIPGFGISLHNRGVGFAMNTTPQNSLKGRKKPFHTLAPAMITDANGLLHAFGVMGGTLQPQGHFQILRALNEGQPLEAAIHRPRWRIRDSSVICFEEGFDDSIICGLSKLGHQCKVEDYTQFGGAQWISRSANGHWAGCSDLRKDGHAAAL